MRRGPRQTGRGLKRCASDHVPHQRARVSVPSSVCSVEFLWPKELALPGRWMDGGFTYRAVLRNG
jgi:hypothetical protein